MSRSDDSGKLLDEWLRYDKTHFVNNKEKEPANPRWYIGLGFHYLKAGDFAQAKLMAACALYFQPRDEVLLRALYNLCIGCGWKADELLAELALSTSDFQLTTLVAIILAEHGRTGHLDKMLSSSRQFFGADKWLTWVDSRSDSVPDRLKRCLNRFRAIPIAAIDDLPHISCVRTTHEPLEALYLKVWLSSDLQIPMQNYLKKYLDCTANNSQFDNSPIFACVVNGDKLKSSFPKSLNYIVVTRDSEIDIDEYKELMPKPAALYLANTGGYGTDIIAAKIVNHIKNLSGNTNESIT